MLSLGPVLNQCIKRHAVKSTECTKQRQIDQDPPTSRPREKLTYGIDGDFLRTGLGKKQVDREQTQADRPERHKTQLNTVA